MATPEILAIPCKLDAFVFNATVCGGTSTHPNDDNNKNLAKIAPLSQPNYTFLRFERTMVQNDILNFTDLHKTGPAPFNPRFTDLGTGLPHTQRQGVYLHWIVPRPYRTGSTISQDQKVESTAREQAGFKPKTRAPKGDVGDDDGPPIPADTTAPDFNPAPPRWLVIRKVEKSDPPNVLPEVDAWVVESDRRHNLDDIPTKPDIDLQVDFSPYIRGGTAENLDGTAIDQQAEVFIGYKESASTWTESYNPKQPSDKQPGRVDLNLLNSSNQLFPDYQPHNSNVFSIIDTLQYGTDKKGNPLVVNTATVSYYVLGWHSSDQQDPFGTLDPNGTVTRGQRLAALNMVLDQADATTADGVKDWLDSKDPTRILCHGAMYNVLWDGGSKPPIVPADNFFKTLNSDMPVSVGTTPMDSLLTYIKSHVSPNVVYGDPIQQVEQDLLRIQKLLHAHDDGVEGQAEADDIVYNWNFASTSGGNHYFLASSDGGSGDKGRPTAPSPTDIRNLATLNNCQRYLDGLNRQLELLRWGMFAFWWQYMTDLEPTTTPDQVKAKSDTIMAIMAQIVVATNAVQAAQIPIPGGLAQMGVLPPYYQARDPTMLVAGIESGWPWDYLNQLQSRVDTQLYYAPGVAPEMDPAWTTFCNTIVPKLDPAVQGAALSLVGEFLALDPDTVTPPPAQDGYEPPLYHDLDKKHALPDGKAPWRDRWEQSQAWFPLFLEWEAEYTHIPLEVTDPLWTLDQRGAWPNDPVKLRYGITPGVELADITPPLNDKRTVSGRVLILPQPELNLQTIVTQILANLPEGYLTPEQARELKDNLHELAFLSSPLSGFTEHLLTRVQGNHIKPTVRDSSTGTVKPFAAAIDVGKSVGFDTPQLTMMGIDTDLLPYGTLVSYLDDNYCPFKPATHGQFRFTALNVIDKFGQAITAIDPTPMPVDQGPPPLYPCISEYYVPQSSSKDAEVANTVVQDKPGLCQYVQLPPAINQPARLNSTFVDYLPADPARKTAEGWQALTEWDDPVWGWVVPNYADSGIQLFLPDGTFFREIRLGGPNGATESGAWLPFDKPTSDVSKDPNVHQLQLLADKLADKDYLHSFIAMVNTSMGTSAPPPTAYSEFLSALIGKPLALVKVGFSLELATDQLFNTSTILGPPTNPEMPLLPSKDDPDNHYRFQMQLGDPSRMYDGLIAYLLPSAKPTVGDALDLSMLYTHFVPKPPKKGDPPTPPTPNLTEIAEPNYPLLSPFWIDPMDTTIVSAKDPSAVYAAKWTAHLQPFGALVDPFTALHAYTGILPTSPTQLPTWTWQTALARMTAFFHMGPLLATTDAPPYTPTYALGPDDYDVKDDNKVLPGSGLGIPAMQTGQWAWLQPYDRPAPAGVGEGETGFMAMDMAAVDQRPRFEPAPYTALEGYMQLRRPIGGDVPGAPSPPPTPPTPPPPTGGAARRRRGR